MKQTSNGDVDAVTGGPPVEIGGPTKGVVAFLNPTFAMQWAWIYWQAAAPLLAAGSLFVVLTLVRSVRTGTPFTSDNASAAADPRRPGRGGRNVRRRH